VDESSPAEPADFAGRRLLEAEALVRAAPLAATVLRLGGIYGPGRASLVAQARAGARGSEAYTNRIHRDDAAAALLHLAELEAAPDLVLGVDSEPARGCEVMAWLAARLGLPAPRDDAAAARSARGSKRCRNERLLATGFRFAYPTFREGYAPLLEPAGTNG
jgi:nucleoside-diphosphate-sugar epimerase